MKLPKSPPRQIDPTKLFLSKAEDFAEYHELLLKQYELYITMADKISERRNESNKFYLSVNVLLITVLGVLSFPETSINLLFLVWFLSVGISGIGICFVWMQMLNSYRTLNSAKFKVINEIEKELPAAGYLCEWDLIGYDGSYRRFALMEKWIPRLLMILYFALAFSLTFSFLFPAV